MKTLAEQLREKGLISEKTFRESEAQQALDSQKQGTSPLGSKTFDDLDGCKSMREFKQIAKIILARDKTQIKPIIQKAHDKFKGQKGDKKFFWFFYQIRDGLKNLPAEKHEDLLRKAFRKAGSTFKISD